MIVKTGANYQAEGGYIEASVKGSLYTITKDDKSVAFGGAEETGPLIIPITFINDTDRTLSPTCITTLGSLPDTISIPVSGGVAPHETATLNCLGVVGIRQRLSYNGSVIVLNSDSEYVTIENSASYASFTINKIPENGDPITVRVY